MPPTLTLAFFPAERLSVPLVYLCRLHSSARFPYAGRQTILKWVNNSKMLYFITRSRLCREISRRRDCFPYFNFTQFAGCWSLITGSDSNDISQVHINSGVKLNDFCIALYKSILCVIYFLTNGFQYYFDNKKRYNKTYRNCTVYSG